MVFWWLWWFWFYFCRWGFVFYVVVFLLWIVGYGCGCFFVVGVECGVCVVFLLDDVFVYYGGGVLLGGVLYVGCG